jgi:hypothetical protein
MSVVVDENPKEIKAQELQITRWMLTKYQQLMSSIWELMQNHI